MKHKNDPNEDITARASEIATATEIGIAIEIVLSRWERRAVALRDQARECPARTATDRGVVVSLHRDADTLDHCRSEIASVLATALAAKLVAR